MSIEKINVGGNEYDVCDAQARAMAADAFSEGESYTAGKICIHENKLCMFTADKSAGPWDASKVKETTLAEIYSELNSRTTFAEYSNVDLNMVNEYCFVVIDSNSESYNAPSVGRYLCTPQAIGFQIGIDMNAGNFYARGHNWGGFSDWRSFSFS